MSAAMVVVVLHTVLLVVMVVAKVLFAPFQVHLQPLFTVQPIGRSPRGTLPVFKTQKCWRAMLLGRWHQNTVLARSIRRRQHPVAWAKLQLSTNHRARYQQLPPFQPIRAREAAAPVWRLRKRFARPCISSPAVGWLPSISSRVHEGSCFCPL